MDWLFSTVHPRVPFGLMWIDAGLFGSAAVLLSAGYSPLRFETAFFLTLLAALRLSVSRFTVRATLMGFCSSVSMGTAVLVGDTPVGELWEIPGHGLTLLVALLYSAERERRSRSIEKARVTLMSAVTHDIRNPLAAALGMAGMLQDRTAVGSSDDVVSFAETITDAVEEAMYLVDDLSTATRLDAGELHMAAGPVDVGAVLDGVGSAMAREDETISVEVEPGLTCIGDEMRLRQVLRNLVSNAQRYGGDAISLRAFADGPLIRMEVADDGQGIPEDQVDNIFEPFTQIERSDRPAESMGLGLSSARQVIRQMGGDLVYSRRSGETVFVLTLWAPGN